MTSRRAMRGVWAAALAAGSVFGAGCSSQDNARPLTADSFVARRVEGRANPQPIDQPGHIIADGVKPQVYEGSDAPEVTGISPSVREVVQDAGDESGGASGGGSGSAKPRAAVGGPGGEGAGEASAPRETATDSGVATDDAAPDATPPNATAAGDPSGQYVVFGTVLSKVNNQPIYAHKVLTILDSSLRARAQRLDPRAFRREAAGLIARQIKELEDDELVFAAAQNVLTQRERELADLLTARWRNEEITKAGGSVELAKRRWADQGWNFDERAQFVYRLEMRRVYMQKRILPLVQVTASDIRRFYDANRAKLFTKSARARFRVIKIDPRNRELALDGPEAAERLALRVREQAVSEGADFEALARKANDPLLKETGGAVGTEDGWLARGSYVAEKVEAALWELRPGQVTDVIEEGGAYYVAKLEERQDAAEQPFEDRAVQDGIRNALEVQQLTELTRREEARLQRDAVIQRQPDFLQVAVDMAMQRYPSWAAAK